VDRPGGAGVAPAREGAAEALPQERVQEHPLQLHPGVDGVETVRGHAGAPQRRSHRRGSPSPGQVWAVSTGIEAGPGLCRIEAAVGPGSGVKVLNQPTPPPSARA
jgi:hypothetical protein